MFSILGVNLADQGFYINLDSSTDRKDFIDQQIQDYEIKNLKRIPGVIDEWRHSTATQAQINAFKEASKNEFEIIFVGEDDFDIRGTEVRVPYSKKTEKLKDLLQKISLELQNVEWDVVLFGCTPRSHASFVSDHLARIDKSTGAWAYLIKRKAYEFIIHNSNYKKDMIAIDDWLPLLNTKGFTTLLTSPILIHHANNKFESTLQPCGICAYDAMIDGSYDRYVNYQHKSESHDLNEIQNNITVVIAGHIVDDFLFYVKYLLHSLPPQLHKCKFILHYDTPKNYKFDHAMHAFLRDHPSNLNVELSSSFGGLISSFHTVVEKVKTPYMLFLEHDWVFLKKNNINFTKLCDGFKNNNFVNAVWFNKDDNAMRGFEICEDIEGKTTPFQKEDRVTECDLITTCRWSNNPVLFRLNKLKHWLEISKNDGIGIIHQGSHNIEETLIPLYRKHISENKWEDVRDEWGTYLYGNLNDDAYVGHLDGTKRYQGIAKSQPEINGEEYIKNNPI